MKIGRMNNPAKSLISEVNWTGKNGFDFIDLTLEPPNAHPDKIDIDLLRETVDKYDLDIIGHTAYYLPFASPYKSLSRAAIDEFIKCMEFLSRMDVKKMTVHPDEASAKIWGKARAIDRNIRMLKVLVREARKYEVKILIENVKSLFNTVDQLEQLFNEIDGIGFTLDIGHCNLPEEGNNASEMLRHFADRLDHIHLSDNVGHGNDLHLPLGAGGVRWNAVIEDIHRIGYDGTFTLEVFSRDYDYILMSKQKFSDLWHS